MVLPQAEEPRGSLNMDNALVEALPDNEADGIKYAPLSSVACATPPPHPSLMRRGCFSRLGGGQHGSTRHAFLLVDGDGTRHLFCAENDEERQAWVDVLALHIEMMQPTTLQTMLGPDALAAAHWAPREGNAQSTVPAATADLLPTAATVAGSGATGEDADGEDGEDADTADLAPRGAGELAGTSTAVDDDDSDDDGGAGALSGATEAAAAGEGQGGAVEAGSAGLPPSGASSGLVLFAGVLRARVGVIGRLAGVKAHYCELLSAGRLAYYSGERKDAVRSGRPRDGGAWKMRADLRGGTEGTPCWLRPT